MDKGKAIVSGALETVLLFSSGRPEFRNRALFCLSSYVATSEAAGNPFNSLQKMFATEEHAQIKDDAVEEIQLWAAQSIYKSIFRIFLDRRIYFEVNKDDGFTALLIPAAAGQETILQLLHEQGADMMAKTNTEATALHSAAEEGVWSVVQLLEKGAGITAKTNYGATLLHDAAREGHYVAVQLLLEKVADMIAYDGEG